MYTTTGTFTSGKIPFTFLLWIIPACRLGKMLVYNKGSVGLIAQVNVH